MVKRGSYRVPARRPKKGSMMWDVRKELEEGEWLAKNKTKRNHREREREDVVHEEMNF